MTIMVESSRTFLFTEYARGGCGTFKNQGTDPKVWDALPDKFSQYPNIEEILKQAQADKAARRERLEAYYDDARLDALVQGGGQTNGHAVAL